MGDVEAAGLLKMDFLGLRNLTILAKSDRPDRAVDAASASTRTPSRSMTRKPTRCSAAARRRASSSSSRAASATCLQRMKPDAFHDIIATAALYRPGPLEGGMVDQYIEVKHGRKPAEYPHPVMEEVLAETNGVMVYQEQVMRILNLLGGIPLSSAYKCIKAISKKKLPMIAKFREEFLDRRAGAGPRQEEGRRAVRDDQEVRRLRLQQEPLDRVRPDRVHDRLPQGALPGAVHGGPAVGRHPGPQLQEQGRAGRAPRGLQADGITVDAPTVNRATSTSPSSRPPARDPARV